ncbi:MAG: polysaccharide deacetylase family protein [Candidatus Hodarchaeota archaeon]
MANLVLTYDFERYGNPSLPINHSNNRKDRRLALNGLKIILKIHKEHNVGGTVFVLGRLLELCHKEITTLFSKYSFDIQQHTYSHILFKEDKYRNRSPASPLEIKREIQITNDLIKKYLDVDVIGLSVPIGFHNGLKDKNEILKVLKSRGIKYIKSDTRGPGNKLPGPFVVDEKLKQPYFYENGILELTGQGWHDCVIKGLIPHEKPKIVVKSPLEELKYYIDDLEFAIRNNLIYIPSFHPWSIAMKDPKGFVIHNLIKYALKNNIGIKSASELYKQLLL